MNKFKVLKCKYINEKWITQNHKGVKIEAKALQEIRNHKANLNTKEMKNGVNTQSLLNKVLRYKTHIFWINYFNSYTIQMIQIWNYKKMLNTKESYNLDADFINI